MSRFTPPTNNEWVFEVIDGPSTLDLVRIAMCDLLNVECSRVVVFRFKPHHSKWIDNKITAKITEIEKICKEKWIIMGDWIDAKFESRPCSFRIEYSSSPKTGTLTFSFEYGHLTIVEEAYLGICYKTFR